MNIVCDLFPNLTQLDLTGPFEVFHRIPGARVHLAARTPEPVRAEGGLTILPTIAFADAPQADILCVPGGWGVNEAMLDDELLAFVRRPATWVTSVCTGALVLGAAGLLDGYGAATHWAAMEYLSLFGARATERRVVVDRNRITGGGVTAGIDIALRIVREIYGGTLADEISLAIEYGPANDEVRERVLERLGPITKKRLGAVALAAQKLRA
ncbi:MAG: thiamine biosynthesis protein ThiJ [Acidobacteria bacterium]|nr:MAG: thiamine biosynthesis protein ThiJ [Acidobacteriota bacterium]